MCPSATGGNAVLECVEVHVLLPTGATVTKKLLRRSNATYKDQQNVRLAHSYYSQKVRDVLKKKETKKKRKRKKAIEHIHDSC